MLQPKFLFFGKLVHFPTENKNAAETGRAKAELGA